MGSPGSFLHGRIFRRRGEFFLQNTPTVVVISLIVHRILTAPWGVSIMETPTKMLSFANIFLCSKKQ